MIFSDFQHFGRRLVGGAGVNPGGNGDCDYRQHDQDSKGGRPAGEVAADEKPPEQFHDVG